MAESQYVTEGDLICEALVREIRHARRWMAVREAWYALLHVRAMQEYLVAEHDAAWMQSEENSAPTETSDG